MSADVDPFADQPRRLVGRAVTFDKPGTESPTSTARLTGTVVACAWIGRTKRGAIPDYRLTIRGQSGRELTVSLVESHASFPL